MMEDKYRGFHHSIPSSPYRRPRSPISSGRSLSQCPVSDRDREIERITSKYTTSGSVSSPVGPGTVFLSKKMKELTEKQSQQHSRSSSSPVLHHTTQSSFDRTKTYDLERHTPTSTSYSNINHDYSKPSERNTSCTTRSFLDELSSKRMTGEDRDMSPTDSFIDRMILSAQQEIQSPTDYGLSRHSSIISLTKHRDSPFQDYRSLPSSRLLETDAMKSFNLESKYLDARKVDSHPQPHVKDYTMPNDKVPNSGYESSPMKTYSQTQMMSNRDRANSFHDIRDRDGGPVTKQRTRHSTLPYGVGSADLTAAKFDMDMKNIMRELEDTGFFHQSRSLKSGYLPSSSSNISTPAVFTSNPPLSLPLVSADCSRRPSSCNLAAMSYAQSPSHTTRPTTAMTMVDNQPLVVLRKQDLDDFLKEQSQSRLESRLDNNDVSSYSAAQSRCVTPAPSVKDTARDSWVKKKTNLSSQSDVDYKKLALVNDDLLKMWEESQAENTKLRLELSGVRSDLETARHQLDSAENKVKKNNAVTDQEKREKKIVVKKLAEMEEELKTLDQLKADNSRLRDENTALLRVIAKMSK